MRRILVAVIALAVLLAIIDVSAKVVAERQLGDRAQGGVPAGTTVDAHIKSIPFLGRIASNGRIDEVDFHLTRVKAGSLIYPTVDVQLAGVRVDRHRLLGSREARIVAIDSGRLSTQLGAGDLSTALAHRVIIRDQKLYVDVLGRQVQVTPKIEGGKKLTLGAAGIDAVSLDLPQTPLLPCAADVAIGTTTVEISCSLSDIPQPLIDAANAAAGG
jgi:hypothetical protein